VQNFKTKRVTFITKEISAETVTRWQNCTCQCIVPGVPFTPDSL